MARKSQAERLNMVCSVMEQVCLRLKIVVSIVTDNDAEAMHEIQEFADMFRQLQDEKFFSIVMDAIENGEEQK